MRESALRRWSFVFGLMFCTVTHTIAAESIRDTNCQIAVQNGSPTKEDNYQAWRMISQYVMLPGIRRPIIYPAGRNGAWTINDKNEFVPFQGEFPSNPYWDHFDRDPTSGRIIGNGLNGVFVIEPGETVFRKVVNQSEFGTKTFRAPRYIDRMKGFLFFNSTNLYFLDGDLKIRKLPIDSSVDLEVPGTIVDLPSLKAILFAAKGKIYLRNDNGLVILLASLEQFDFLTDADVGVHKNTIYVETYRTAFATDIKKSSDGIIIESVDADVTRYRSEQKKFTFPIPADRMRVKSPINDRSIPIPVRNDIIVAKKEGLYLIDNSADRNQSRCN